MPNLNEFIHKDETPKNPNLEKIDGLKGCKTCDESATEAYWDSVKLEMTWTCKNGHLSVMRFN